MDGDLYHESTLLLFSHLQFFFSAISILYFVPGPFLIIYLKLECKVCFSFWEFTLETFKCGFQKLCAWLYYENDRIGNNRNT